MHKEIEDAILRQFKNDLNCMDLDQMQQELNRALNELAEIEPWAEALTIAVNRREADAEYKIQ